MKTRGWPDGDNIYREPVVHALIRNGVESDLRRFNLAAVAPVVNAPAKPSAPPGAIVVRFDGGTHKHGKYCPHGSWKIDDHPIQRIESKRDLSSDECEIHTALCAVKQASRIVVPESTDLVVYGDSVNAITRCGTRLKRTKRSEYRDAAEELYNLCHIFRSLFAEWKPRSQSVRLFGH